jgi:hypothetical protein
VISLKSLSDSFDIHSHLWLSVVLFYPAKGEKRKIMERNLSIQLGLFVGAVLLLVLAILLQPGMEPRQHPDLVALTNAVVIDKKSPEPDAEPIESTDVDNSSIDLSAEESTFDSTPVPNDLSLETTY